MANYLYNGVELPNINGVWTDKETYPYAFISEIGLLPTYLFLCSNPVTVTPDGGNYGTIHWQTGTEIATYTLSDGVWTLQSTETSDGSVGNYGNYIIWSSFDLLNETDDSVILAASDPVSAGSSGTANTYARDSFLAGLALGLMGVGGGTADPGNPNTPDIPDGNAPYIFSADSNTLTINQDDGSLTHAWSWRTMQYDVEAKA